MGIAEEFDLWHRQHPGRCGPICGGGHAPHDGSGVYFGPAEPGGELTPTGMSGLYGIRWRTEEDITVGEDTSGTEETPKGEWREDDFLKLRRMKEAYEKPESVLDVALGRTQAYMELLHEQTTRSRADAVKAVRYECALYMILDFIGDDLPPDKCTQALKVVARRALGLGKPEG